MTLDDAGAAPTVRGLPVFTSVSLEDAGAPRMRGLSVFSSEPLDDAGAAPSVRSLSVTSSEPLDDAGAAPSVQSLSVTSSEPLDDAGAAPSVRSLSGTSSEPLDDAGATPALRDAAELSSAVDPSAPVRLRVTPEARRAEAWALVLSARGLRPAVRWADGALELYVPSTEALAARRELAAADHEDAETRRAAIADAAIVDLPDSPHAALGGVLTALALLAFFWITGPAAGGAGWFSAGSSDAARVLAGEAWRGVTALTLHADATHVLSNIALGGVVVAGVMRWAGVGFGAALVLAAGTFGNLMNAWAYGDHHRSIGFSTAVFGAVGLLGALTYVRHRRRIRPSRPPWTALAGAIALLAALGASATSDLLAHMFGAIAGLALGLAVGWRGWRPATHGGQAVAGLVTAGVIGGAWALALA